VPRKLFRFDFSTEQRAILIDEVEIPSHFDQARLPIRSSKFSTPEKDRHAVVTFRPGTTFRAAWFNASVDRTKNASARGSSIQLK
jgi:hypothetical protein